MMDLPEEQLAEQLKSADAAVRERATAELWDRWFRQKGAEGLAALRRCDARAESGDLDGADAMLTALVELQPDFAEAWNRRAVLRFSRQRHREAIADCEKAIELKPWHFGALHGLGLCHMALGEFAAAAAAFRRALAVQPFAEANAALLRRCTLRLN